MADEAAPTCLPKRRGHDQVREIAAEHLLRPVPEGPLEGAIHIGHPGIPVNADDGVESSLENDALPGLTRRERGRPRLRDLAPPVSLASQFHLPEPLSLSRDQLLVSNDRAAQLGENR